MNLAEAIYRHSQRLPDEAACEALDFIEFLEQRYGVKPPETAAPPREFREPGSARGKLVIFADDDDHLADFKDYMPYRC